jgi:hypothetical protein
MLVLGNAPGEPLDDPPAMRIRVNGVLAGGQSAAGLLPLVQGATVTDSASRQ